METTCCVVGGGPAGMMLGYLLARRGVPVTVLEKHADFFRDFRGDTVHPSTLQLLYELDLLDAFLAMPHQRVETVGAVFGDFAFHAADFRHVPGHARFTVLMPQWDFLNFLAAHARKYPSFDLRMNHQAVDLIRDGPRCRGVVAQVAGGETVEVRADLVVGADGRHSVVSRAAGLQLREYGVPIDVLWFRLSRRPEDPRQVLGNVNYGKALILIDRADYFQAGLIVPKGSYDEIRRRGLPALRQDIQRIAPFLDGRVDELRDWEQVKVLTVMINRLRRWWKPGLLCIGDAAHAMSPAGGVGINLAIQDAVAAARILARPLAARRLTDRLLADVERRRQFPARVTQAVQVRAHQGFARIFAAPGPLKAPWQLKMAVRIPGLQRAVGYAIGIGARPEHVREQPHPARSLALGVAIGAGAVLAGFAAVSILRGWQEFASSPVSARRRRPQTSGLDARAGR